MYTCVKCNRVVSADDRADHSASRGHRNNGGSATVVDADYQSLPRGIGGDQPGGTSKIR